MKIEFVVRQMAEEIQELKIQDKERNISMVLAQINLAMKE